VGFFIGESMTNDTDQLAVATMRFNLPLSKIQEIMLQHEWSAAAWSDVFAQRDFNETQAARLKDDYRAQSLALQAAKAMQAGETERADKAEAQLAQHVTEWLCDKCNTIHTAPTGFNHSCKTPNCDGWMRPSSPELRRVEAQRDQLAKALKETVKAWEDGADVFGGIQQARAALAAIKEKQ